MRTPRILVFQHMEAGHPGLFREFLHRDGIAWQTVRLDLGEAIPDLSGFDALWVMGGPQDVWQEAAHPWLVAEKAAIREAVLGRAMPFLGICLGHQLLVDALGGTVRKAPAPEIGVFEVALREPAGNGALLAGLPARSPLVQWHRAEVQQPPEGARVLAASRRCAIQAIAVGERAFGLQFHAEVDLATLEEWLAIEAAALDLERGLGPDGPGRFAADVDAHAAGLRRAARRIYLNFRTLLPAAAAAPGRSAAAPAPPRRPPQLRRRAP